MTDRPLPGRRDPMERAGDYVLGLMDDAERERAERDMETDAEFRNCVAVLAMRMHALDRTAAAQPVPDRMWAAIEARIAAMPQMQRAVAEPVRIEPAALEPADTRFRSGRRRPVFRAPQAFGGLRGVLAAACIAAALGVGYFAGQANAPAPMPVVVVVLADEANQPGAIVEAYGNDAVRIVPLTDFAVPEGKVLEVWTLFDRDVGPVSLGTMASATEARLLGPDLPVPVAEQLYEITLEDAPRSPVGRPTGPILVKGLAQRPAGS